MSTSPTSGRTPSPDPVATAEAPAPDPLDERARRRADWRPGVPMPGADGREWHLREPVVSLDVVPDFDEFGAYRGAAVEHADEAGEEFERLVRELAESRGSVEKFFALAIFLLRPNYDLSLADLRRILRWRKGDPRSDAMITAIEEAAFGSPPKPSSVGSDPPSGPTESPAG